MLGLTNECVDNFPLGERIYSVEVINVDLDQSHTRYTIVLELFAATSALIS